MTSTPATHDGTTCPPDALAVQADTARAAYRRGQPVAITVTAGNAGEAACTIATGPCLPQVVIVDGQGQEVWNRAATQVVCAVTGSHRLPAAAALSRTVVWDGRLCAGRDPDSCSGRAVLPGRYRISARWGTEGQGRATFVERN